MSEGYTSTGKIDVDWWVRAIARGKDYRKEYACESDWPMWRKWARGQWQKGILPSNVYFKMIRTMVPRVYYRNPSVSLTPTKPGLQNMLLCKVFERIDNRLIDIMGVKQEMKRMVLHGTMFGTGAAQLGFGTQHQPAPDPIAATAPDAGTRRRRNRIEYDANVHNNMPWFGHVHPGRLVVPHGCVTINDARWVCVEDYRTVDDLKDDPRFKDTADLNPGIQDMPRPTPRGSGEAARSGVQLWTIRDKKSGCVFVIAPASGSSTVTSRVLFEEEDSLQINGGLPVYPLIFNTDDEVFWGIPDSKIIGPQQIEKNEIRTQIMRHRRVALAKILVEEGVITPDEQSKLIDGNIQGVIKAKDIQGIREFNPPPMPEGLVVSEELVDREVQEILGLGVNQFGEYAPGSADRSATEAGIVNQASQIRTDERRDVCADLLVAYTSDMNVVLHEHWTGQQVEMLAGPAGVPIWIAFEPHDLHEAIYDIKIDPDTSLPQTKAIREQKAVQMYGILKTNPLINPVELTRFLLHEMQGVEAESLMQNPSMQTSQDKPMGLQDAMQHIGSLPPAAIEDMRARLASSGPPVALPPNLV